MANQSKNIKYSIQEIPFLLKRNVQPKFKNRKKYITKGYIRNFKEKYKFYNLSFFEADDKMKIIILVKNATFFL